MDLLAPVSIKVCGLLFYSIVKVRLYRPSRPKSKEKQRTGSTLFFQHTRPSEVLRFKFRYIDFNITRICILYDFSGNVKGFSVIFWIFLKLNIFG